MGDGNVRREVREEKLGGGMTGMYRNVKEKSNRITERDQGETFINRFEII